MPLPMPLARVLLAALIVAPTAAAQFGNRSLVNVSAPIDLGTYDWATKTFLEESPLDEGTTETAILSNVSGDVTGYTVGTNIEADFFYLDSPLETGGSDALTSFRVGYVTRTFGTTTFTIRLHTEALGAGDLGASRNFTFVDFPGSDSGTDPTAYVFDVLLSDPSETGDDIASTDPIVLEDGAFAVSFQASNTTTGPLWIDQDEGDSPFEPTSEIYTLAAGFVTEWGFVDDEGFVTTPASPYIELRATPLRIEDGPMLAPTIARGLDFEGVIEMGEVQSLRFEGLEGEKAKIIVRGDNKLLSPSVAVIESATGAVVASAGNGKPRARVKAVLPSTGVYEVRVSGLDDTFGPFSVQFRNKPPKAGKRPTEPVGTFEGQAPALVFPARGRSTLDVKIKTKGETDENLGLPRVVGDVGELDLAPYLTIDGNGFEIDDLPIPTLGGYQIFASDLSDVDDDVTQKIKARVRTPKVKKKDSQLAADADVDLAGDWVREDFVTDENRTRFTFDLDRNSGRSELVVNDGNAQTRYRIGAWNVTSIQSEFPDAHTVEYTITDIDTSGGLFGATLPQGVAVEAYYHPDGDPNRIEFFAGNIRWRRATDFLPDPPELSDGELSETDGEFGLPSGLPTFVIDCDTGARWFEIYRAVDGAPRPSRPLDFIEARCTGSGGTYRYFDFSAESGTTYRYWVRELDDQGRRSGASAPITVEAAAES